MAPGSGASNAAPQQIPTKSSNIPAPPPQNAPSPPSRRDLTSWWKQFKGKTKKGEATGPQPSGIFGVPLNVSIKYANVAISLTGDDGQRFIYGYVPIVVAKCGVFLKEKATEVEGIFRLSGSAKRINALQEVFDSPDRFGKGLDWTGYTVHDAANIFRRYLNQLPEPIVPLEFYERFREPLRQYRAQHAQGSGEEEASAEKPPFNSPETVAGYQQLIKELPPLNRQLLLYILDLLTVFAAKADVNRMTAANLSAIFQPGLLSHPDHHMSPDDYKLSQDVLVFLIENQDSFLFGMAGTAADEQTVKDVQAGYSPQLGKSGLQRSASNASAGADSLRKYEAALRRNASASSKHSKTSAANTGSPTGMVHRSNTVPSKRPSGLSPKVQQGRGDPSSPSEGLSPRKSLQHSRSPSQTPSRTASPLVPHGFSQSAAAPAPADPKPATSEVPVQPENATSPVEEMEAPALTPGDTPKGAMTPTKERKLSSLFAFASPPDDGRQKPNRLKKKRRIPDSASASAQSSTHSLHTATGSTTQIPPASQSDPAGGDQSYLSTPKASDNMPGQSKDESSQLAAQEANVSSSETQGEAAKNQRSRPSSARSRSSVTDLSDADRLDDPSKGEDKEKRRSWRFHRSRHSRDPTPVGVFSNARADASHSSVGSPSMSQENVTGGQQGSNANPSTAGSTLVSQDSNLSSVGQASVASSKDNNNSHSNGNNHNNHNNNGEREKKGFFDKFRAKVAQVKDRDGDKSRAKSPPSNSDGEKAPRNSHSLFSSLDSKSNRDTSSDNSNSNNTSTTDNQPTDNREQREPAAAAAAPTTTSPSSTPAPVPSSAIPDAPVTTTEDGQVIEKTASGNTATSGEPEPAPVTPLKTVDENAPLSLAPSAENVPATTNTPTAATTTKTDTSATPAETTTDTAPGPADAPVPGNPAASTTEPAAPASVTEAPVLESVNETSKPPAAAS